jgi:hypothetical protein
MAEQDTLFPLGRSDTACVISVFFATVFASAAGIGGGAVLVPLFTLIGEFTEHEAIPLALSTVFGASLFSTFGTYIWEKHPIVAHRPRIAYDVVSLSQPKGCNQLAETSHLGHSGGIRVVLVLHLAELVWISALGSGSRFLCLGHSFGRPTVP